MMDICLPPWVSGEYDGYLLMKFFARKKYLEDFLEGKLYFNTSDYFSSIENKGQADCDEGNEVIISQEQHDFKSMNLETINGQCYVVVRDFSNEPDVFLPSTVLGYSPARNRYRKIICFYAAYVDIKRNIIDLPGIDMHEAFGDYAVVIPQRQLLYSKIANALRKHKGIKEAQIGFVEYIPEGDIRGDFNWGPLKKRKEEFSWQNEIRATIIDETKDPCIIDLETNLHNIAYPIMWKNISAIHMDGGKVYFPIYELKK